MQYYIRSGSHCRSSTYTTSIRMSRADTVSIDVDCTANVALCVLAASVFELYYTNSHTYTSSYYII